MNHEQKLRQRVDEARELYSKFSYGQSAMLLHDAEVVLADFLRNKMLRQARRRQMYMPLGGFLLLLTALVAGGSVISLQPEALVSWLAAGGILLSTGLLLEKFLPVKVKNG